MAVDGAERETASREHVGTVARGDREGKMSDTKVLGITGGIGTGKSTLARFFCEQGVPVIDVDRLGHRALKPGTLSYDQVVEHFGEGLLDAEGRICRRALGAIVFSDASALKRLESITHPAIKAMIQTLLDDQARKKTPLVVLDAALLFEMGLDADCHEVWVVWCQKDQQITRVMNRNGSTRDEVMRRMNHQMPLAEKKARADRLFDNSGSEAGLRCKFLRVWRDLTVCLGGDDR